jgi:hypothetical protein
MEIFWKIANSELLSPSQIIVNGNFPLIQALEISDISLGSKGVPSTFSLTGASHHAILTEFAPRNSFFPTPGLYGQITTIGPVGTGLLWFG